MTAKNQAVQLSTASRQITPSELANYPTLRQWVSEGLKVNDIVRRAREELDISVGTNAIAAIRRDVQAGATIISATPDTEVLPTAVATKARSKREPSEVSANRNRNRRQKRADMRAAALGTAAPRPNRALARHRENRKNAAKTTLEAMCRKFDKQVIRAFPSLQQSSRIVNADGTTAWKHYHNVQTVEEFKISV